MQSCDRGIFEVIVVDDGSIDGTRSLLESFDANFDLKTIFLKENSGRSNARNCAVAEAKGDILIFHDSDMIAEKDYVSKHIEAHECAGTVVSGMNWSRIHTFYYKDYKGHSNESLWKQLKKMGAQRRHYGHLEPIVDKEDILSGKCFEYAFVNPGYQVAENYILLNHGSELEGYFFPWSLFVTNNCSAYKNDVLRAGGFDGSFLSWGCEDIDLGYRLYKSGCRFKKAHDILSLHQEHPVNYRRDIQKNICFLTNKYNDIDILLFYFGSYAGIMRHQANIILQELEELNENDEYVWFTELFRKMLMHIRDRICTTGINNKIPEIKEIRQSILSKGAAFKAVLYSLEKEKKLQETINAFNSLIKNTLGSDYKKYKI
jgi:glycosyltransferase involved in cell wall biosynthesis